MNKDWKGPYSFCCGRKNETFFFRLQQETVVIVVIVLKLEIAETKFLCNVVRNKKLN